MSTSSAAAMSTRAVISSFPSAARSCWARSSGIRINLAGREEAGTVQPGAEYEAVVAGLEADLVALVDADSGVPLVSWVERTAEGHEGPYVASMPDLLVHWVPATAPVRAVRSPWLGTVEALLPDRTGHHHAHGLFIASGPGLEAGGWAADARVVDLGVTVAALLGVDLPEVDGRVIPELVGASHDRVDDTAVGHRPID